MNAVPYANRLLPKIYKVNDMQYQLEHFRIRSLAALGLAFTTGVIAMVAMVVSAL